MPTPRKDFEHIRKTMGQKSAKEFVKASAESPKHKALAKLALRNMRRITGDKNYKTPSSPYKKFNDK